MFILLQIIIMKFIELLKYLNPYYYFDKFWEKIKNQIPENVQNIVRDGLEIIYTIVLVSLLLRLLLLLGIHIHIVPTPSMVPTINVGDLVFGVKSNINAQINCELDCLDYGRLLDNGYILIPSNLIYSDGQLHIGSCKGKDTKSGDIAFYHLNIPGKINILIVHRGLAKIYCKDLNKEYYLFKGDNDETNPYPDGVLVPKEDVLAKYVFKIPFIGYPRVWLYYLTGI